MNRRQMRKRFKQLTTTEESRKTKKRRTSLMHKWWVHKKFYVRRKTTVKERMLIHYCLYWIHKRMDAKGTSRFLLQCLLKGDSPDKAEQKLWEWKKENGDRFQTVGMW